jgi:hypothetical protein
MSGRATRRGQRRRTSATPASRSLWQRLRALPALRALRRGGRWRRSDWLTLIGIIIAIIALVGIPLSYLQLKEASRSNEIALSPTSTTETQAQLQVSAVAVAQWPGKFEAEVHDLATLTTKRTKISGSVIDITLRNLGSAPALITRADLSFRKVDKLDDCTGGGPLEISAFYDVRVPVDQADTRHPFVLHRDMRFVVDPNAVDRFAVSVGAKVVSEAAWPWIYYIDVSLQQDSGAALQVGTIIMLDPMAKQWTWLDGWHALPECTARNASLLQAAVRTSGIHSPGLLTFYDHMKQYLPSLQPACVPSAFFKPAPNSALLGFRCRGLYAAAVTASGMGGALYGGRGQADAHIYVARGGKWVEVAGADGGIYISFTELLSAGLDPQQVASSLGVQIQDTGSEQSLVMAPLGCGGTRSQGPCQ